MVQLPFGLKWTALLALLLLLGCAEQQTAAERASEVVQILASHQLEALADYAHPAKGVRFSPSAYVDLQQDRALTAQQLAVAMQDERLYLWGYEEGSGEPLRLNFADYFARYVYDADFARAEKIAIDESIGRSTTVNNLAAAYPGSRFVEYHFSGFDPQFEGLDWKSLRLVFQQLDGTWYLVAIIHAQWAG